MSILDVNALVLPVSAEAPAGDSDAYSHRLADRFRELRREEFPEDFDDLTRPDVLKQPDWPEYARFAADALIHETKDIRVVCHLIEGWTQIEGIPGLCAGLSLLHRLLDSAWDRLNPPQDAGLDARITPLANLLDDDNRGVRFPSTIRRTPLANSADAPLNAEQWRQLICSNDPEDGYRLKAVLSEIDEKELKGLLEAATQSLEHISAIATILDEQLGEEAPALLTLAAAVRECLTLVEMELNERGERESAQTEMNGQTSGASVSPTAAATNANAGSGNISDEGIVEMVARRADMYLQLQRVAHLLEKIEPNSPTPFLVRRAVELGKMPFPRLMGTIVDGGDTLARISKQLGIPCEAAEATETSK